MKQFPKLQWFNLDIPEQMERGLEKNNFPPKKLNMVVLNLTPTFGLHAPSSLLWSLWPTQHSSY